MAKVSTDRAKGGQTQFPLPIHDKTATAKVNGVAATIASQNEQSVTLQTATAQNDLVEITFNPVDQFGQGRTETFVPTSGGTVTPTSQCGVAAINPAATLAALTITFPPSPGTGTSGRTQQFVVQVSKDITAVTWAGGTLGNTAPSTLAAGQQETFEYSPTTGKWYNIQ